METNTELFAADIGAKLNLDDCVPNMDVLREINHFTTATLQSLHHVIITLTKEAAGYVPVFALDYEVLHAYLFPTIQHSSSRVSPAMAAHVLEHPDIKLVVPPGTIIELSRFANRFFPVLETFESLVKHVPSYRFSEEQIEELCITYKELVETGANIEDLKENTDNVVFMLSEYLSDINKGFARLNRLIAQGRLIPMMDYFPEWHSLTADHELWIQDLKARLSARRPLASNIGSNSIDAQNLALVLRIDKDQGRIFTKSTIGKPRDVRNVVPKAYHIQLLTQTLPILDLDLNNYGGDVIAQQLKVLPLHMSHRRHPWVVCPLESAAIYCAFRSTYGSAEECLEEALEQASDLTRQEAALIDAEAIHRSLATGHNDIKIKLQIQRFLNDGAGKWYLKFRDVLVRTANDMQSLAIQRMGTLEGELSLQLVDKEIYGRPFFEGFEPKPHITNVQYAAVFGIREEVTEEGNPIPFRQWRLKSTFLDEVLIQVETWPQHKLHSVKIPYKASIQQTIDLLNDFLPRLASKEGQVVAIYEEVSDARRLEEFDLEDASDGKYRRVIASFPKLEPLTIISLLISGTNETPSEYLIYPAVLSIETSLGDLHINVVQNSPDDAFITVNTETSEAFVLLGDFWLKQAKKTHIGGLFYDYISEGVIKRLNFN